MPSRLFKLLLICSASLLLVSSCTSTSEVFTVPNSVSSERRQTFENAEALFAAQNYETALPLYIRLSQSAGNRFDPINDESLWRLVQIYEKNDESEKALLALDELSQKSFSIAQEKILLAQIKNFTKTGNRAQAQESLAKFDRLYRQNYLSTSELYDYLEESLDLNYDRKAIEEAVFLGDIQKYFVFIMEGSSSPENEKATELLIQTYNRFFHLLKTGLLSAEFKHQLSIALLDQLRLFDRYKLDGLSQNPKTILKFSEYSNKQKQFLTESFFK
ncbi:tetratricopeptide repeat protein [Pseudobdellovibrio exovorus]|uniref:Lipoprotein n=1 Tax=Pseudobdellovibrio exovorus JSS TaxID=1184267 RepID=M4V5E1_9BACT|nr:hypothetical protein [Pseudobdellovibrio exovorus]AGH94403.1 hypothetical protein A11Q_183 [Pseudobdellovibrio exovorus JSS]